MSDHETVWQELLTSALLGVERHPAVIPDGEGGLAEVLARLDSSKPNHFLLHAAGIVALFRQAGRLPINLPVTDRAVSETDALPRCTPAAADRLAMLLSGEYKELIPEWLKLAASAQIRVPEELLPDLLEWGEKHIDEVDLLLPVIGKRGRWLAKQIPWVENVSAAVFSETIPPEAAHTVWQTGRKAARLFLLRRLRKTDPVLALDLTASSWSEEPAEERAEFLEAFKVGLSMVDEPFLEAALDDRAKEVRKIAADVLAHLAQSRLVQRQTLRAQALLKFKAGGFLRKAQIEVVLPEQCDKEMIRDGVNVKPAITNGLGEKGEWLLQILRMVPPSIWSKQWGKSPSDLMEIAADGDWNKLLHEGWITATIKHQDPEWAEAILKIEPRRSLLFNALPPQRRLAFLISQIQTRPLEGMELLFSYSEPWGIDLTRLALRHMRTYYLKSNEAAWQYSFQNAFRAIAKCMDPSLTADAVKTLPNKAEPGSAWEKGIEKLLKILEFRHQMTEEFK